MAWMGPVCSGFWHIREAHDAKERSSCWPGSTSLKVVLEAKKPSTSPSLTNTVRTTNNTIPFPRIDDHGEERNFMGETVTTKLDHQIHS